MGLTIGKGTVLKLGASAIALVRSVSANISVEVEDTTSLSSAAREFSPTIADWGTLDFEVSFDSSGHSTLIALITTPVASAWTVEFVGGVSYDFTAVLTSLNITDITPGSYIKANISLKVSGVGTIAA